MRPQIKFHAYSSGIMYSEAATLPLMNHLNYIRKYDFGFSFFVRSGKMEIGISKIYLPNAKKLTLQQVIKKFPDELGLIKYMIRNNVNKVIKTRVSGLFLNVEPHYEIV